MAVPPAAPPVPPGGMPPPPGMVGPMAPPAPPGTRPGGPMPGPAMPPGQRMPPGSMPPGVPMPPGAPMPPGMGGPPPGGAMPPPPPPPGGMPPGVPAGPSGAAPPGPPEIPPLREAFQQFIRLVKVIRPYWGALLKGMALGLVLGMIGMIQPWLSKTLIDEVYPTRNVTLMQVVVAGILAIAIGNAVMGAIRGYYTTWTTAHLSNATALLFFNHLQHLRVRFFDEHRVGEIMSRFGDMRTSLQTVSRVFETLFVNGAYLILVPPFLFLLQWKLAVVSLITIPLTVLITTMSARLMRKYWKKSAEAFAELGAYQVEVLSHIRTLKAMGGEHRVYARAEEQIIAARTVQLKGGGYSQIFGASNAMVRALGTG